MTGDYSNQHMVPMKRVVAPRDEARDDFDVFAELSERWEAGGRERFTEGKTDLEWLETFYQIAAQRGAAQGDAAAVCGILGSERDFRNAGERAERAVCPFRRFPSRPGEPSAENRERKDCDLQ